ncbi:unnamed protein product [Acanthoscelides obtectus]|uniref:Uncharacterized protein n=1 Tax=Acanthoscelides obtectus TaxID=200917 RepID=A0A9P0MFA5_ACAOB|nr:unnamed protein product [Acanthoscelides obtectus]CAK1620319.1 hypothetical protein AOBTE_LOCUS306 [Acanthoscelides obtectus]
MDKQSALAYQASLAVLQLVDLNVCLALNVRSTKHVSIRNV